MNINDIVNGLNGILFSNYTVYALLLAGVLFTIWSGFGQYRALTHGVQVIRGKYDDKADPGAINHFQALSTALSATVGLGNIAGVAVAVALGGPGAILWMWVIGVVGMALKMTEVTQSMLYRNTDDPENPHGGPMFVVRNGLAKAGALRYAAAIGFALVTLFLTYLAYNTFQSWIAIALGGALAVTFLGLGFVSGKAIGTFIGGVFVVTLIISAITGGNMFQAWNVADVTFTYFKIPQVVTGIILAVLVALVIIGGIKRIGKFAGRIVPFMCVSYLLAGLIVLLMHVGEIPAMLMLIVKSGLPTWLGGESAAPEQAFMGGTFGYAALWGIKRALFSSEAGQGSAPIAHSAAKTDEPVREGVVAGLEPFIDTLVVCSVTALVILSTGAFNRGPEAVLPAGDVRVVQVTDEAGTPIANTYTIVTPSPLPSKLPEALRILRATDDGWTSGGNTAFVIIKGDVDANTGRDHRRIVGRVVGEAATGWRIEWPNFTSAVPPELVSYDEAGDIGIYGDYAGASLTAHAFDRAVPGLGMWLVTAAAWLFALSTIISWSYYGEQGVVYLSAWLGESASNAAVLIYKFVYCALILLTTILQMPLLTDRPIIGTDTELDMWTTLGLGVMLVANIPIMLLFGAQAMKAYHSYMGKLKRGEFKAEEHKPASLSDVMEGKDVE